MAERSDVNGTMDGMKANNGGQLHISHSIINSGARSGWNNGVDPKVGNEVSSKDSVNNDNVVPKGSESPSKVSDGRSSNEVPSQDSVNNDSVVPKGSESSDSDSSSSSDSESEGENENGRKKKNDKTMNKKEEQKSKKKLSK